MRASTAYFAGIGTVAAAIVAGIGGGLLFANIVTPTTPKGTETTHLERRMQTATTAPSEPVQVQAPPQGSVQGSVPGVAVAAAPSQAPLQTEPVRQVTSVPSQAPAQQPEPVKPIEQLKAAVAPAAAAAQPVTPPAPVAQEQRTVPSEDSFAKARDADIRRDADAKRTAEKRRLERRQQWTEKRKYAPRQDQELRDVEQAVREETEPRRERVLAAEPVRSEMPLIRLFGPE